MSNSRRKFIRDSFGATAAVAIGGILPGFSSKSYARILGANERVRVGMMGVHSRGLALAQNFAKQKNAEVISVSDVDSLVAAKCIDMVGRIQNNRPQNIPDFRVALENKALDALVIAAPDHWHAPAALLATKAGKHVYLEKPCSHNPHEGELLLAAVRKYKNVIQMGDQRRSWPNVKQAIDEIHQGVIGKVFNAKTWYVNNRPSIGIGKVVPVPATLNYDLWQGPAPRRPYKDNLIHYNWHWHWHWGTGESLNNGTHMVDLARWGMQLDFPTRVSSGGGRFYYEDDWETPDTQNIDIDFGQKGTISFEGRSCNNRYIEDYAVGVMFYGQTGSLLIGGGNEYKIYDQKNKLIKEVKSNMAFSEGDKMNPSEALDALHLQNFFEAIKHGAALNSDIQGGYESTLLMQLGNIAYRTGHTLQIDPGNGHILHDSEAQKLWSREYQKGWEPTV